MNGLGKKLWIKTGATLPLFTLLFGCVGNEVGEYYFNPDEAALNSSGDALNNGGGGGEDPTLQSRIDAFSVNAVPAPKIDLLFVVDNSGSMADEQQVLANSFQAFISGFIARDVDFQIGIITTDVTPPNASYWNGATQRFLGYQRPDRGALLSRSAEQFLNNQSTNLVTQFTENVLVGTRGSGAEQGFHSLGYALDSTHFLPGAPNANFIRDEAMLAVIMVTDENETIQDGEAPATRIARVVQQVEQIKSTGSRAYRFDFILNLNNSSTYQLAAQQMGSRVLDIENNFGQALVDIGSEIVNQAQNEFVLTKTPRSALTVEIAGTPVAEDATDGYSYHSARNSVELHGDALVAVAGSTLTIAYQHD